MVPEPLLATPPAPVVGAGAFCGFKRILQSAQVAAYPPPVTVTVAPRAAVDGVNFVNAVIAVCVEAVTAVVSAEVLTVRVLDAVPVELPSAPCATFGLTIPAACVNVMTKSAPMPLPAKVAPIPWSPFPAVSSKSGTVMVTARPSTVTALAETSRPAFPGFETVDAFSLIAEVAIADGTVYLEPNVTVIVPPTGTAVIPAVLEPVTE